MLKVANKAKDILRLVKTIEETQLPLGQEEREFLDIEYNHFKKLVAHEFKWGDPKNAQELLRKVIQVDNAYWWRDTP